MNAHLAHAALMKTRDEDKRKGGYWTERERTREGEWVAREGVREREKQR